MKSLSKLIIQFLFLNSLTIKDKEDNFIKISAYNTSKFKRYAHYKPISKIIKFKDGE